jgi:hypothetical protein
VLPRLLFGLTHGQREQQEVAKNFTTTGCYCHKKDREQFKSGGGQHVRVVSFLVGPCSLIADLRGEATHGALSGAPVVGLLLVVQMASRTPAMTFTLSPILTSLRPTVMSTTV